MRAIKRYFVESFKKQYHQPRFRSSVKRVDYFQRSLKMYTKKLLKSYEEHSSIMIVSITDAFGLIINKKMLYEVKKLSGGRVDAEALEFSNSLSQ